MATRLESPLATPHAAPAGRGNRRKKKKKEEKSCLLSRWCCEEGKEGHGQPGAVGVQRPGTAGATEGRGRLPSPRAGHRRFPTAGKAQPELWHAGAVAASPPQMLRDRGPGPKPAVAAPAQRSCLEPAGLGAHRQHPASPGMEQGTKTGPGNARWAMQAVRAARRHGSRKRHRGPAQCNK